MRLEVELALAQQRDGQRVPFSIFHHARGEHIGSTSLWHIDRVNLLSGDWLDVAGDAVSGEWSESRV
jgi:hypothetical protein